MQDINIERYSSLFLSTLKALGISENYVCMQTFSHLHKDINSQFYRYLKYYEDLTLIDVIEDYEAGFTVYYIAPYVYRNNTVVMLIEINTRMSNEDRRINIYYDIAKVSIDIFTNKIDLNKKYKYLDDKFIDNTCKINKTRYQYLKKCSEERLLWKLI